VENAVPRALGAHAFDDRWSAPLRWAVVGAWSPEKGQDLAIAAARELPEWELLLIGPTLPPHESWAAAQRATLPANVRVLGVVDDVPALLAADRVQVVALPSRRRESFSMAVVEAIASSCAAVLTREAGMERVCEAVGIPRVDGADGLVRELRRLAAERQEGRALAQRQHTALLREYGPQRFADGLRAAYESLRPAS
jgi:glycosyltransferase involved in cell wall biosynthesis